MDGHGWSTATKRGTQAEDERLNHGCWTSSVSSKNASYFKHTHRHAHLPQRWRPWWRLLCSPDECSPAHTLPPAPPAPCNLWHHSADTQSWMTGTKRRRTEFYHICYHGKKVFWTNKNQVKTILNRWNIFLLKKWCVFRVNCFDYKTKNRPDVLLVEICSPSTGCVCICISA